MRLLVLGGTQFAGRALAEAALRAGHEVTLFHRGLTNPGLFPEAEHVRGDRDGELQALAGRTWDACVDTSGYVPRLVRASAELLRERVGRYVFVSTISVYADLSVSRDEDGPLVRLDDPTTEDVEQSYGGLKALCEQTVESVCGRRATIVRPGFVVGPHDPTGRLTWWVHRAAAGGEIVVPASVARRLQLIDVRDLADFLLRIATTGIGGTFNVTGPVPPITMIDVIRTAADVAGATVEPVVVEDAFLSMRGLGFAELPLWIDDRGWRAWAEVNVSRAVAAGLRFRPLRETVEATLREAAPVGSFGLDAERQEKILRAWRTNR